MTGVELLVDRAQLWEQSAAKHVSIGPQLEQLSSLARRWRRFELLTWQSLLKRVIAQHAAGESACNDMAQSILSELAMNELAVCYSADV